MTKHHPITTITHFYAPHFLVMNACRTAWILALAAITWATLSTASYAEEAEWLYQVEPGDSLSLIAKRYLQDITRWRQLQQRNGLGDPRKVPVGSTIKIPYAELKQQPVPATVLAVRGDVTRVENGSAIKTALKQNDQVQSGDRVVAEKNSGATIVFIDGSSLRLMEESAVVFKSLRGQPDAKLATVQVLLEQGRVETQVTPLKTKATRYEIITPTAQIGVRGTDFRVQAKGDAGVSTTEVLEGLVLASNTLGGEKIPKDFGTVIVAGKAPLPPIALLEAPSISNEINLGGLQSSVLNWTATTNANQYRAQIALDKNFDQIMGEVVSTTNQADVGHLPPGRYYLRVRAIDSHGLEGKSAYASVTITSTINTPTLLTPRLSDHHLYFSWSEAIAGIGIRLQLARDADFNDIVFDDRTPRSPLVVPLPSGSVYYARAALMDGSVPPKNFGTVYRLPLPIFAPATAWQSLPLMAIH